MNVTHDTETVPGPADTVMTGEFDLGGQRLVGIEGGSRFTDVSIIAAMPAAAAAAAAASVALRVSATGAVTVETVALLDPDEIDPVTGADVSYRPPGA